MTEQSIVNQAIWRAVATELERIASAEWPSYPQLVEALTSAVDAMPADCPQQIAIGCHELYGLAPGSIEAHRWLLRALAGALRAEAAGAEHEARHLALVLSREAIAAGRAVKYCARCQSYRPADQPVCGICGQSQ